MRLIKEKREVSMHLAHAKPYHPRETPPALFMTAGRVVLGENPPPTLDHPDKAQPKIELYAVDIGAGHSLGPGRKNLHHFVYRMRLRGYSPESDVEYRTYEVPHCHASAAA